jgi:predicted nucleic acid-binding Zn ribbon protein
VGSASPHTAELPAAVTCPFCGGRATRPLATFGSLLMTSQYYCDDCRTTFEWVRREDVERRSRS